MVKVGDIYLHNERDELLLVTSVSPFVGHKLYSFTFVNKMVYIRTGKKKVIQLVGSDRFPIMLPEMLRPDYRKVGVL